MAQLPNTTSATRSDPCWRRGGAGARSLRRSGGLCTSFAGDRAHLAASVGALALYSRMRASELVAYRGSLCGGGGSALLAPSGAVMDQPCWRPLAGSRVAVTSLLQHLKIRPTLATGVRERLGAEGLTASAAVPWLDG